MDTIQKLRIYMEEKKGNILSLLPSQLMSVTSVPIPVKILIS